ncbi:diguanylate cyclase [Rhodoferax aquaticus]|uniref:diguanylate cyclase n=1 Tax=Rhodoferax aquaticus TaxID=2527691 RepID=A0A515ERH8_9BURK|nr:diguanylate cyclase [Rhodoferax aquaticus]QDL55271.1 diguanylate cyclase [Rhodoferax aquaticus]
MNSNANPVSARRVYKLPSPTGVALSIMQLCEDEHVTVGQIAKLVQSDPALTGRLLKQANSLAEGLRPVMSALEAVNRLGLQSVRLLALSFSLVDQHGRGECEHFNYTLFWSHALLMAVAVKNLGEMLKLGMADELFSCGLLSRVGCLALATAYPVEYSALMARGLKPQELLSEERKALDTDHIAMTDRLLKQWGLPGALIEPLKFHETPEANTYAHGTRQWRLVYLTHLSLLIANFVLHPSNESAFHISELRLVAGKLGLDESEFTECVDDLLRQWRAWGNSLSVQVKDVTSFAAMKESQLRPDQCPETQWFKVLVAGEDAQMVDVINTYLRDECKYETLTTNNSQDALSLALKFKPHAVLTQGSGPLISSTRLCQAIKSNDWSQHIYVMMLLENDDEHHVVAAFDAGVDDCLPQPVHLRCLHARLQAQARYVRISEAWERDHKRLSMAAEDLAQSNQRLQHSALTDPLTSLANRRAGLHTLAQAWSSASRKSTPFSVISIDIDHFKSINDVHGHLVGDDVLKLVSECLQKQARKEDTVCRWGGEEFLVICPNLELREGAYMAERIRQAIAQQPYTTDSHSIYITASLGIVTWDSYVASIEQLLGSVDQALYAAKRGGRNCVAVHAKQQVRVLKVA